MEYDVAIVGAGPAGSTCAAICAQGGCRTLLLERARFPRDKVCGDCLNPGCWPVLDRLGVAARVRAQPHARITELLFIDPHERALRLPLLDEVNGEIAIPRSLIDAVLLNRARELGADVHESCTFTSLEKGWSLQTSAGAFQARVLIAADGRNSSVARVLGLLPAASRDRVALQAHLAAPPGFGQRIEMRFLPAGYCGVAAIGNGQINLCLVARPERLEEIKAWAASHFSIGQETTWRTITPLRRSSVSSGHANLLFAGDAAQVVEPFTGEGIYYALASGELAARHVLAGDLPGYRRAHAQLYRGRLWINHLAREAVLHPGLAGALLTLARRFPEALAFLTSKIIGPAHSQPRKHPASSRDGGA